MMHFFQKYHLLPIVLTLLAASCATKPNELKTNLAGYWEIVSVEAPNGSKKAYGMSQNIDYFAVDGNKGFRKKVQPNVMGDFMTSEDKQYFTLSVENRALVIIYNNALDSWKEEVTEASKDKLVLKNKDGMVYTYRRYEALNLED